MPQRTDLDRWLADLRNGEAHYTLLAVCPTSDAVLRAALSAASDAQAPLLLAATRNQVDVDGGYTGWTPTSFVQRVRALRQQMPLSPPVLCCLDHGGPWCKDAERRAAVDWETAYEGTQATLRAGLEAGYRYAHIDTTVDPHHDGPLPVAIMVKRAAMLIEWAESYRTRHGHPPITYEVGIEEEAPGSWGDHLERLQQFLDQLYTTLPEAHYPSFVVSDVGTSFGTGAFDETKARRVVEQVDTYGALVKSHYSDFVTPLDGFPRTGIGGANIGPGLSAVEYDALCELEELARRLDRTPHWHDALRQALVASGRWRKWVDTDDAPFEALPTATQRMLLSTGSRYVWTDPDVQAARSELFDQVADYRDADAYVQWRLRTAVLEMLHAFNLVGRARSLRREEADVSRS